jgi:hypothetical protein
MDRLAMLLAASALAAALTVALLLRLRAGADGAQPLPPPSGAELFNTKPRPAPARADPREVASRFAGAALAPSERTLARALESALAKGEEPSYRVALDAPARDNAAQAMRDEVLDWVRRKMAALGFSKATAKPAPSWRVKLEGLEGGRHAIGVALRSAGVARFQADFELPAAYSENRLDGASGSAFAAPPRP